MALPADYRIVVVNNTGISIDSGLIEVDIKPYSGDGSGGVSHGNQQTASASSVSAGGSVVVLTKNGSTSIGLNGNVNGNLSSNGTSGPDGDLEFFVERSTDGGTSWERDPVPVGVLSYSSLTDKSTTITA